MFAGGKKPYQVPSSCGPFPCSVKIVDCNQPGNARGVICSLPHPTAFVASREGQFSVEKGASGHEVTMACMFGCLHSVSV